MTNPAGCPTVWLNSEVYKRDSWQSPDGFLPNLRGWQTDSLVRSTPAGQKSV